MRRRRQHGFGENALDRRVGALARRAAGAVGHRDEIRLERREPCDRFPERLLHLRGFRREKFERDVQMRRARAGVDEAARRAARSSRHLARLPAARSTMRGSRASQSDTAILPSGPGGKVCCRSTSRPAASSHCVTVSAAKPSRRWACSSRKNSRSCGAKSTTSSRPPGRSTRAASRMARRAVVEEVQHLMDDDDVERIARQREVVDVAVAHAAMLQAGAVEPRAGERQHVERQIEAEPALDIGRRTVRACARCRCRDRAATGSACRQAPRGSPLPRRRRRRGACGCGPIRAAWRRK